MDGRLGWPLGGGDTLVIRAVNFRAEQSSARSVVISEGFELEKRYTLVGKRAINRSFTAVDLQVYTEPLSGEQTLTQRFCITKNFRVRLL